MKDIKSWEIGFEIINKVPEFGISEAACYQWSIVQKFDYQQRSNIRLSLAFSKHSCQSDVFNWHHYPWVMWLTLFFSSLSLCLHLKYLFAVRARYEKLRKYYSIRKQESNELH
jgi:hypothetical protein